jgi:hypothetical protein
MNAGRNRHDKVKIAGVRIEPMIMRNRENLDNIPLKKRTAALDGSDFIVCSVNKSKHS